MYFWQHLLDLLCKTFSVLNLLLFVMVLLVLVCLMISLFVEVFICLFRTVLTPWGAEPFPSFVCMYNGHFKNASNNDVLLVGYSAIEWLTRLMRPHRQLSLLSQPQIALYTVLQMCAVVQQGTGHKKNICLSYLVKRKPLGVNTLGF